MESTRAIVLRKTRLTETSLIVTWLTETAGRIKTVAKGARRGKSAFAGHIDLFYLCDITVVRSKRGDLHTLTEVRLVEPFSNIRTDYTKLLFAAYAAGLAEWVTEPDHPAPELFDLVRRALGFLEYNRPDRKTLQFLEMEVCRFSGITPPSGKSEHASRELLHHFGKLPESREAFLKTLKL
ncbi:MAG TPA: DNA repair protein RecO [Chthoniobacterales bacterium]